jgi:hypothetical protein
MTDLRRASMTARTYYRLGVVAAVLTALFLGFGIGALGIIGRGGPPDLMYVGALAVAVLGAVLARFRPGGMALALGSAAVATLVVGVIAIAAGLDDREGASVGEILMLSAMYAVLFAVSGWFFWRAAEVTSPA